MRSGKHDENLRVVGANRPDELRLLAAHHVRDGGGIDASRAGYDPELTAGRDGQRAGEKREIGWAIDIWRLDPALAAADHSTGNPRRVVVAPVVEQRIERRSEAAVLERADPERSAAGVTHGAAGGQTVRARRRRTPVDRDQGGAAGFGHGPRR